MEDDDGRMFAPDASRLRSAGRTSTGEGGECTENISDFYRFANDRKFATFVGQSNKKHPFCNNTFTLLLKQLRNNAVSKLMGALHADPVVALQGGASDSPLPKRPRTELLDGLPESLPVTVPAVDDVDVFQMHVMATASLKAPVWMELTEENVVAFRSAAAADYSEHLDKRRVVGNAVEEGEGNADCEGVVGVVMKYPRPMKGFSLYKTWYCDGSTWRRMQKKVADASDEEEKERRVSQAVASLRKRVCAVHVHIESAGIEHLHDAGDGGGH